MSNRIGQILKLTVSGHGSSGEGVCMHEGRPVFVDNALEGEMIRARILQDKSRFMKAELLEILIKSPLRISPACPHYGICGGCQLMHQCVELQKQIKTQMVTRALWHIGRIAPDSYTLLPIQSPKDGEAARNKVYFHVNAQRAQVGFYARASRQIIDIPGCIKIGSFALKARQTLGIFLKDHPDCGISGMMVRSTLKGQAYITLVCDQPEIHGVQTLIKQFCAQLPVCGIVQAQSAPDDNVGKTRDMLFGTLTCEDEIDGLSFLLSPQSFFQVHPAMTKRLYDTACALLQPKDKTILDVYCGVGTISLYLAKNGAKRVMGIESVAPAIEDAKDNAARNGFSANTDFICAKAEAYLPTIAQTHRFDAAVIDPPRKGCDAKVIETLCAMNLKQIVYVSCNPATLARDLKLFVDKGYRIDTVAPHDLFPDTQHVETVCLLSKLNAKQHIEIDLNMDELDLTDAEKKATYREIKDYVLEHSGLKVSSLYIAQVKQKCGIIERENYNKPKSEEAKQPLCPPEKEKAIKEALRHFGMI